MFVAGWSSPVARWAHNPKVAGSNPVPATKSFQDASPMDLPSGAVLKRHGDVAQLGEHLICIQGVAGSTPVISTIFIRRNFYKQYKIAEIRVLLKSELLTLIFDN
jgi:hypothetical protein